MSILDTIVDLSHEFGTTEYVRGGGGNTSAKDADTLWVKPSGTTLKDMQPETFVTMDRAKINELYDVETPEAPADREELVKNMMAAAVTNDAGRPSVEAPLHNVFSSTYVVHTHPCLVNGMTCAVEGAEVCAELFPDALWVEYIDPGYTLCMEVRQRIQGYRAAHGREPEILMLKNHGVFIAADTADEIRDLYARVMGALAGRYAEAGISTEFDVHGAGPRAEDVAVITACLAEEAAHITCSEAFAYVAGPLTPDHLVYARAFPLVGDVSRETVAAYEAERGYLPKVIVTGDRVYGAGTTQSRADLALEFAQDGAQVAQLTAAFGGIDFMTDRAREFIENWEVESYRSKQV